MSTPVFIEAIGFAAPGMSNWRAASAVLRDEAPLAFTPLAPHAPAMLPVNERRRATPAVRLAFQAAEDAMQWTTRSPAGFATVFASSDADLAIIHRICSALANTPRLISPTDFHNSVHNAAAGYWHIAAASHAASSTICAYDDSFAAGLLEACVQVRVDSQDTLLVAFDLPAPEPLHAKRTIGQPCSVALALTGDRTERSLAAISLSLLPAGNPPAEDPMTDAALESLRRGNPAARALPLLRRLARNEPGRVLLPAANGGTLAVELRAP